METPSRSSEHPSTCNVVFKLRNQAKISKHVAHQGVFENRKPGNHEWDFATTKLLDQVIPVSVLTIEYGEVFPFAPGAVDTLQFSGNPAGFVFLGRQFDDTDAL